MSPIRIDASLLTGATALLAMAVASCGGGGGGQPSHADAAVDAAADDAATDAPTDAGVDAMPPAGNVYVKATPAYLNRSLDLVFVVDSSGAMMAEQATLAAAFPRLLQVLETIQGGLPDLHIGVLSADMGAGGVSGIGCGFSDDGNLRVGFPPRDANLPGYRDCRQLFGMQADYLSDVVLAGTTWRTRNYTGALADAFTCTATLGNTGCGFEQHLESAWRAFQTGKNPGFHRADARLAIVFLADEDDCSVENAAMFGEPAGNNSTPLGYRTSFRCHEFGVVCDNDPEPRAFGTKVGCKPREPSPYLYSFSKYVNFFRGLKANPDDVIVAGILGTFDAMSGQLTVGQDPSVYAVPGMPAVLRSCGAVTGDEWAGASPPVRLQKFLAAFPDRHQTTSICDTDLSAALTQIGQLIKSAIADPCVDAALDTLDTNPHLAGVQYMCTVADVVNRGSSNEMRTAIAECPPGQTMPVPCWRFVIDTMQCPSTPEGVAFKVERGTTAPARGTVTELRCELPASP